jgi:glycerate-2-kinase
MPNAGSERAGRAALDLAVRMDPSSTMVVLLSGGASAMLAVPASEVTLGDKIETTRVLLEGGADIVATNTVRKHLSAVKGGQLAAAAAGASTTFALSDVVAATDLEASSIGSGPTVPDPSTYADSLDIIRAFNLVDRIPQRAMRRLLQGVRRELSDTPKPGDTRLARSAFTLIGSRADSMQAASERASVLGYGVAILEEPLLGEASSAAVELADRLMVCARSRPGPTCIICSGETTVRVRGRGRGGRNQELALALVSASSGLGRPFAVASIGTDGVDGPTDAAGAIVDSTTADRAARAGLSRDRYLADNDSYSFFDALGDLIRTGATGTNVGDVQVALLL